MLDGKWSCNFFFFFFFCECVWGNSNKPRWLRWYCLDAAYRITETYLCYANCWERDSDKETKDRTNDRYYNKPHAFVRLPDGTVSKRADREREREKKRFASELRIGGKKLVVMNWKGWMACKPACKYWKFGHCLEQRGKVWKTETWERRLLRIAQRGEHNAGDSWSVMETNEIAHLEDGWMD